MTNQLQNIADLVSTLMLSDKQFDMGTIERATLAEMDNSGLHFLTEYLQEDFFDKINAMNITEAKIGEFVERYVF